MLTTRLFKITTEKDNFGFDVNVTKLLEIRSWFNYDAAFMYKSEIERRIHNYRVIISH